MERRERKAGAKGSAVVLWYSQAIDALRLLPGVLQQYLKMKSSFPSIQEGICSVKRSWYHDVMQDVTSNSSDDIIAITCAVPGRSWGWLAVEGAAIIPAMMITTTTEPLSEVFVALWKRRNVNRESSLGKADAFKRLPRDSHADKVSFGCLWGIRLGRGDRRTSRHGHRSNSPSCTCYNNKLKSASTVMMLLSVSEMSNGSWLMAFLPLCLCWDFSGRNASLISKSTLVCCHLQLSPHRQSSLSAPLSLYLFAARVLIQMCHSVLLRSKYHCIPP